MQGRASTTPQRHQQGPLGSVERPGVPLQAIAPLTCQPHQRSRPAAPWRHPNWRVAVQHSIRRGVDVFTLQVTLGYSSSSTTAGYVAAYPADSSALRLGRRKTYCEND
jgi:hypothetical protein